MFRDRDAPVTPEGLIFRTYGYDHPEGACFCDLEYAPEALYRTDDPRAVRELGEKRFYKFYFDGGLRFAGDRYPEYQIRHRALGKNLVGLRRRQIARLVRPDQRLQEIVRNRGDALQVVVAGILDLICDSSDMDTNDFGVFGSLAHGFHHPSYSDVDLVIYGIEELEELRETLKRLYEDGSLRNEFDDWTVERPPLHWNYSGYSKEEYGCHQRRKLIYAKYRSRELGRDVKVEFEPVRRWEEIANEYEATEKIEQLGRVEAIAEILSDDEAGFMPSIYPVRVDEIDFDVARGDIRRVVSYMEEFRLQAEAGEKVLIAGNLEHVEMRDGSFYQIALSQGPGYFDNVLKTEIR